MRFDKDPLGKRPTLKRIFEACMALPAFDAAQPEKQPDAEP
jgi:maleylpyruvate isomerase